MPSMSSCISESAVSVPQILCPRGILLGVQTSLLSCSCSCSCSSVVFLWFDSRLVSRSGVNYLDSRWCLMGRILKLLQAARGRTLFVPHLCYTCTGQMFGTATRLLRAPGRNVSLCLVTSSFTYYVSKGGLC